MSSRHDFHDALATLFALVYERERHLEPSSRLHVAIAAVADAARAEVPSAAMAAEARRWPQIQNEVRESRELKLVGPHLQAVAVVHGLEVAVLLGSRKDRVAVAAKDAARARCLASGITASAVARVMGGKVDHVTIGADRHAKRMAAARPWRAVAR